MTEDAYEQKHYCGWPQLRDEPTLCGIPREYGSDTTTIGADVTCPKCREVLELGRQGPA